MNITRSIKMGKITNIAIIFAITVLIAYAYTVFKLFIQLQIP